MNSAKLYKRKQYSPCPILRLIFQFTFYLPLLYSYCISSAQTVNMIFCFLFRHNELQVQHRWVQTLTHCCLFPGDIDRASSSKRRQETTIYRWALCKAHLSDSGTSWWAPEGTTSADQCCVRFALCIRCVAGAPLSSIRARLHPCCTAQARSSAAALRLVPYRAISIYFSPGAAASSNPAALGWKMQTV